MAKIVFAIVCLLSSNVAFGQSGWAERFPSQAPSGRNFSAMVYHAARNETVLFGGIANNSQVLDDTWIWDGSNWIQKSPLNSPPPRFGHAMAYDAARQEVVLFGGLGSLGSTSGAGETWVWNGTTWTMRSPATSPPPRDLAAMTYDSARNEVVMFGGRALGNGFGRVLDDTWVWNGSNWSEKLPATHPAARIEHAMTFDAARGDSVLSGGRLEPFPSDFADTWTWNGSNWTRRLPAANPPPTGGSALAYAAGRSSAIMFGGFDNGAFSRNDTWAWNGTNWAQLTLATVPPARTNFVMAYDSARREIVLFGGGSLPGADTGNFNDTWVLDDPLRVPRTKGDCKNGGWKDLVRSDGTRFKNQGACVSYLNTRS